MKTILTVISKVFQLNLKGKKSKQSFRSTTFPTNVNKTFTIGSRRGKSIFEYSANQLRKSNSRDFFDVFIGFEHERIVGGLIASLL